MERTTSRGLVSCPGCQQFIKIEPASCPFCGHEGVHAAAPTKFITKGRSLAAATLLGSALAIGACAAPVYGGPPAEQPTQEQPKEAATEAVTDGGTQD